MRLHLFEFEDLAWFPDTIRKGMTDYLRYLLGNVLNYYKPVIPIINEGLQHTGSSRIIDLASGGGGAIVQVSEELAAHSGKKIRIMLTDKYPNKSSYDYLRQKTGTQIDYIEASVDAADVPRELTGFRVSFSAFHHFKPHTAKAVLQNAVDQHEGIAVFDGGDKHIFTIIAMVLIHPLIFFFLTPFFKPVSASRLFFTYIIPLIPLCTIWDGVISILRLYQPRDLIRLTQEINTQHYIWRSGKLKHPAGLHITYLVGYPRETANRQAITTDHK